VIETDCQLLVKAVGSSADGSQWTDTVTGIRAVAQLLPAFIFKHARRESNEVAHQLAQQALRTNECGFRHSDAPACVRMLCNIEAERACRSLSCNNTSEP
jgi:hypothetical protein